MVENQAFWEIHPIGIVFIMGYNANNTLNLSLPMNSYVWAIMLLH